MSFAAFHAGWLADARARTRLASLSSFSSTDQDVASSNPRGYNQMTERVSERSAPGSNATESSIQTQVFKFTTSVTKFQKQVGLLGTKRDTQKQRQKINDLGKAIKELAKEISEGLKSGASGAGTEGQPSQVFT